MKITSRTSAWCRRACAAVSLAALATLIGCRVVEIEKYPDSQGWRVYHNSHWLDTSADSITATIETNGTISVAMNNLKSTPSEELAHLVDVSLTGCANLAAKVGAAIATAGGSAGAEGVAAMVKSFVAKGGDTSKATINCADGSCTITDGAVSSSCSDCFD